MIDDMKQFLGDCPTHKKLPWKIGAMESGQVAIDSEDGQEVTGFIDPEDAELILGQGRRIADLEKQCREQFSMELDALARDRDTAWAQAHCLALELECLIMDTKDNAIVSKWWDSAFEAMEEYHKLKPGAAEDAEAWAKMRKAGI